MYMHASSFELISSSLFPLRSLFEWRRLDRKQTLWRGVDLFSERCLLSAPFRTITKIERTHDITSVKTTIDHKVSSIDEGWIIRCDYPSVSSLRLLQSRNWRGHTEDDSLGLLDGLSESTHRDVSHPSVQLLWGVEEIHQQRGSDWATTC